MDWMRVGGRKEVIAAFEDGETILNILLIGLLFRAVFDLGIILCQFIIPLNGKLFSAKS